MSVSPLADPQSESRGSLLAFYYIPRDEKFDQVKFSDFAAEAVRSVQHSILPVLRSATRDKDQDFNSLDDVETLYVPKGSPMVTPFNLIPPNASPTSPVARASGTDPAAYDPLTFIHEYAFPSGPDTTHISFPLPQLIAGACRSPVQAMAFFLSDPFFSFLVLLAVKIARASL